MIKRLINLAAVESAATQAFLKCCACLIQYSVEGVLSKELTLNLPKWKQDALPFLAAFAIPKSNLNAALNAAASNKKYTPTLDELIYEAGVDIQQSMSVVKSDNTVSSDQLALLRDMTLWMRTGSEAAFQRIEMKVGLLGESIITQSFMSDVGTQKPILSALVKLVKKLGGIGDNLTLEQRSTARTKNPNGYKEFLGLRRELLAVAKLELRNLVRASGKPYLNYVDVLQHLKQVNIVHNLPEGFVGNVGEDGKLYTTKGKLIDGVPGASVKMNPAYNATKDDTYVFLSSGFGVQGQRYYTRDYKKAATQEKFSKVAAFAKQIEGIKAKWRGHLVKTTTEARTKVLAAILELMYLTSARIGSAGNMTAGKPTYGISTLQVGHTKLTVNKLDIKYIGKKGVKQHHTIAGVDKEKLALLKVVKGLLEGKAKSDLLFSIDDSAITGTEINAYFKKLGSKVSVHKMRHARGTLLAMELLAKCPLDDSAEQAEVEKWYKNEMAIVGTELSHTRGVGSDEKPTGMTAIANYISPDVQQEFFLKRGLRIPSFLRKFAD